MEELNEKDGFEQGYAERSNVTVDYLHSMGRYAEPCDCGDVTCRGWAMVRRGRAVEKLIDGVKRW